MKKKIFLWCSINLLVFICLGCNSKENKVSFIESNKKVKIVDNVELSTKDNIIGFKNNLIIYESIDNNIEYYVLNKLDKKTNKIGSIEKNFISSNSYIWVRNSLILSYADEKDNGILYEINTDEFKIFEKEYFNHYPPFQFYNYIEDQNILIMEPQLVSTNKEVYNYKYVIYNYNLKNKTKKVLIEKEFFEEDNEGEAIVDYSYQDSYIITYENHKSNEEFNNYIVKYDLQGNLKEKTGISFDSLLNEEDAVKNFYVFENYYVFETFKNKIVILRLNDNGWEKIFIPMGICSYVDNKNSSKYKLLYTDDKIIQFDYKNNQFITKEIELELENKEYISSIIINSDNENECLLVIENEETIEERKILIAEL